MLLGLTEKQPTVDELKEKYLKKTTASMKRRFMVRGQKSTLNSIMQDDNVDIQKLVD